MLSIASATIAPLNFAASLSGVPFVGAAAVIVQEIVKACEEVKIYRQQCRLLSAKCIRVLNTLNERASDLEGSQLQQISDDLVVTLERVEKKTTKYSNYNALLTFIKKADIKEGLDQCNAELDGALQMFQINATITGHVAHRDSVAESRREAAENRELLQNILFHMRSESRLLQINTLQSQGVAVAEELMAAGQEEMRRLRITGVSERSEAIGSEIRTSTPVSPHPQDSQAYLQYQRGLVNLHRMTGVPPSIKILNGEVRRTSDNAVIGGVYSDIWQGTWLEEEKVALKALRCTRASDPRAKRRFENEVKTWSKLKHNNVLVLYGIVTDIGQHIHMVSPWQDNGNVLEYAKSHPDANRLELVANASQGLNYLHSSNILHGNMKCANILVSSKGQPCICDFGMSKVIEEVTEKNASLTLTAGGSARWLAPEVIQGKGPSKEADTYSFAMSILELMTGRHPFADCKRDAQVIHRIVVLGKTPARPSTMGATGLEWSDELWRLMERCWCKDETERPQMTQVSSRLVEISRRSVGGLTGSPDSL